MAQTCSDQAQALDGDNVFVPGVLLTGLLSYVTEVVDGTGLKAVAHIVGMAQAFENTSFFSSLIGAP